MQGAWGSTESRHKALRINLRCLSHFHGHFVHNDTCELRVLPYQTLRAHKGLPPLLEDTLGVGFRPYASIRSIVLNGVGQPWYDSHIH